MENQNYYIVGKAHILKAHVTDLPKGEFEEMFKHLHPTIVAKLWEQVAADKRGKTETNYVRTDKANSNQRKGTQSQSDNGDSQSGPSSD